MNGTSRSSTTHYFNENPFTINSSSVRWDENSEQSKPCREDAECLDFSSVFEPNWVKLNSVDQGDPLFVFPGIDGRATRFREMAAGLPCPVIGIQYAMDNQCHSSFPGLAEYCVKIILEHCQPEKRISIVAYSFGCGVAREAVVLLQNTKQRERLKCLVWIEGSSEFLRLLSREFYGKEKPEEYEWSLKEEDRTKVLYASLRWFGITLDSETIIPRLEELPNFDARCGMVGEAVGKELGLRVTAQDVISVVKGLLKKARAIIDYTPTKRIKEPVIFFKASNSPFSKMLPDYNLSKDFDGPISSYEAPGDHKTVLSGEGCKKITRILKPKLL